MTLETYSYILDSNSQKTTHTKVYRKYEQSALNFNYIFNKHQKLEFLGLSRNLRLMCVFSCVFQLQLVADIVHLSKRHEKQGKFQAQFTFFSAIISCISCSISSSFWRSRYSSFLASSSSSRLMNRYLEY